MTSSSDLACSILVLVAENTRASSFISGMVFVPLNQHPLTIPVDSAQGRCSQRRGHLHSMDDRKQVLYCRCTVPGSPTVFLDTRRRGAQQNPCSSFPLVWWSGVFSDTISLIVL